MLRAFQIENQTTTPTSLHIYFMLSDSCTVFLHLYKSIFLLLPSRSSKQCSLWLLGSIRPVRWIGKIKLREGMKSSQGATWNLKHYFSAIFCSVSFYERVSGLEDRKGFPLHRVQRRMCSFGSLFYLFSGQVRTSCRGRPTNAWAFFKKWEEFETVWNQWMCMTSGIDAVWRIFWKGRSGSSVLVWKPCTCTI